MHSQFISSTASVRSISPHNVWVHDLPGLEHMMRVALHISQ